MNAKKTLTVEHERLARDGKDGAGLGANHQTGWTGLVAKLIELYGRLDPQSFCKKESVARMSNDKPTC